MVSSAMYFWMASGELGKSEESGATTMGVVGGVEGRLDHRSSDFRHCVREMTNKNKLIPTKLLEESNDKVMIINMLVG